MIAERPCADECQPPQPATSDGSSQTALKNDAWAASFVWITWAVLATVVVAFVVRYHYRVPFWDEWVVIPQAVCGESANWGWLWHQECEHRIVITKAVYVALARLTHRVPTELAILSAGVLTTVSAIALVWLRRLRGGLQFTDALIPLLLLSFGQWETLIWSFMLGSVLWSVSVCYLVFLTWRAPDGLTGPQAVVAGVCLLAQPLFGAIGLAYGSILALWYAAHGLRCWRFALNARQSWRGGVMLVVAFAVWVEIGLYFVGYHRPPPHPQPDGITSILRGMSEFLTVAWIPGQAPAVFQWVQWPTCALFGVCILLSLKAIYLNNHRLQAFGSLVCVVAAIGLAGAVACGRSGFGPMACAAPRYCTLAAPGLLACYCCINQWTGRWVRPAVLFVMLGVAAIGVMPNYELAHTAAKQTKHHLMAFQHDVDAGVPIEELVERHFMYVYPTKSWFYHCLRLMVSSPVAPFTNLHR